MFFFPNQSEGTSRFNPLGGPFRLRKIAHDRLLFTKENILMISAGPGIACKLPADNIEGSLFTQDIFQENTNGVGGICKIIILAYNKSPFAVNVNLGNFDDARIWNK